MSTHQFRREGLVPSFESLEPRLLLSGAGSDLLAPVLPAALGMAGAGEPIQGELDFGDAPDSAEAPSYPTLLVNDGARHVIVAGFYLGAGVDADDDGQPDINALGDDNDGGDDEDGVTFWGTLMAGGTAVVDVEASAAGYLDAWVDFDGDGTWGASEQVFAAQPLVPGVNPLSFDVPAEALPGTSYARFRFSSSDAGLLPTGLASDGEVEDYQVFIEEYQEWWPKFEQHPDWIEQVDNFFYGWNELSVHDGVQIAADDWLCLSAEPVTGVIWWGSFLGWTAAEAPPLPASFHLAIWTDTPAGGDGPFSHPGQVLWQADVQQVEVEFVGWDFDPASETLEACYRFQADLPAGEWFTQLGEEGVYWLSIAAVYPPDSPMEHPFGWKTRPRAEDSPAPDAAVRIFAPTTAGLGEVFAEGEPIEWPAEGDSWDLAFELVSQPVQVQPPAKHEQLPDEALPGLDAYDFQNPGEDYHWLTLADDWLCEGDPVAELCWWGNYQLDQAGAEARGSGVDVFHLSIHQDSEGQPGSVLWYADVPFAEAAETPTGMANNEGAMIYAYSHELSVPFEQTEGELYWFDISARSNDPQDPALWRWQESARSQVPTLMPAHQRQDDGPWQPVAWEDETFSELAFAVVPEALPATKWSQPPEPYLPFGPEGWNYSAYNGWDEPSVYGSSQILADDWLCSGPEPVQTVEWWGSFLDWSERTPPAGELPVGFHIGIWTDSPAGEDGPFSHPGELIWQDYAADYEIWFDGYDFDPRDPQAVPEACYYFYYEIPEGLEFRQGGAENVYWISIAADYEDWTQIEHLWGWKTRPHEPDSEPPDDAVRIFEPTDPYLRDIYVEGEPIEYPAGESWDLAFVLGTYGGQEELDFGDAPDPSYPTLLASDGARHVIVPGFCLGSDVDAETDGQPDSYATGDDNDGNDDEDGVDIWDLLIADDWTSVDVVASADGYLDAWVDFNGDGDWDDAGERIFTAEALTAGMNYLEFFVPADVVGGLVTYARFRFSSDPTGLAPTGLAEDGEVEDYEVYIEAESERWLKWEQWPEYGFPENVYYGWNELSRHGGAQIAADDWLCATAEPVTEVHWWGSFLGWSGDELPAVSPLGFHLAVWTDVPAGVDATFSHPGQVIWEVDSADVTAEWAGWDYDPRTGQWDSAFLFTLSLAPEQWFQQPEPQALYWLSIAAEYEPQGVVEYPFGWKALPRDDASQAPDDAVVITAPTTAHLGEQYADGAPLEWPAGGGSWDLAFELVSAAGAEPVVKWAQPPALYEETFYDGWNEPSVYGAGQIVADDWVCLENGPVTDVVWWGSFLGWSRQAPPESGLPSAFHIGIWTDTPAGVDSPFSHPGVMIEQYIATDYDWGFDGWDIDPRDPGAPPEACYYYWFELPPERPFWQEGVENIYWLSISAIYEQLPVAHPWGWKTRPRDAESLAPDDAVRIFDPTDPVGDDVYTAGEPIEWPAGESWDTAFVLLTGAVDWGDAPDPSCPTFAASDGARHLIVPHLYLGAGVDGEPDGLADPVAAGDDNDGSDDEDGVAFTTALVPNATATITVVASDAGYLDAWVDFDGDGGWAEPSDRIFAAQPLSAGASVLHFAVPATASLGDTFARFRFSSAGNLSFTGPAYDGEVEDYMVEIVPGATISGMKFHDTNGSRSYDAGEPGLAGWTVFLDDNGNGTLDPNERSTTTGPGGSYSFADLLPGTYQVREVGQPHFTQTAPVTGGYTVVLAAGGSAVGVDFGNAVTGDANGDGRCGIADLGALADNYGRTGGVGWPDGDFNFDDRVGIADLGAVADNYGYQMGAAPAGDGAGGGSAAGAEGVLLVPSAGPEAAAPARAAALDVQVLSVPEVYVVPEDLASQAPEDVESAWVTVVADEPSAGPAATLEIDLLPALSLLPAAMV